VCGVAAGHHLFLDVRDDRYARVRLQVPPHKSADDREEVFVLPPPHVLTGRVTAEDTGKPVAGAAILVMAPGQNFYGKTDADGRYQVAVSDAGSLEIHASAPGRPYLTRKQSLEWPKGAARHRADLALPRGVLVTGKVTEAPSGRPVAGAVVQWFPRQEGNPQLKKDVAALWKSPAVSGADGTFRIPVLPGPGHLLVTGPTPDYVHHEVYYGELHGGRPSFGSVISGPEGNQFYGGQRVYAHGVVPLDVKPGAEAAAADVVLRRGVTVRGRLVGPDDKPAPAAAQMFSRLQSSPAGHVFAEPVDLYGGRFELRGCDPAATYRVFFLDPVNRLGAVAGIAGKQAAGDPVTVRLAPCGTATARLVDGTGAPMARRRVVVEVIVTPGRAGGDPGGPAGDVLGLVWADPHSYPEWPRTDGAGRLTLPALIPGATYRFHLQGNGAVKDCTAEAGRVVDWGDVRDPVVFANDD
jgi:hypothetical protein